MVLSSTYVSVFVYRWIRSHCIVLWLPWRCFKAQYTVSAVHLPLKAARLCLSFILRWSLICVARYKFFSLHIFQPVTTATRFHPVLHNRNYSSVAPLRPVSFPPTSLSITFLPLCSWSFLHSWQEKRRFGSFYSRHFGCVHRVADELWSFETTIVR